MEEDDYAEYDGQDYEDDYDEPDGVGGECMLTVEGGIFTCGMVGSEDCEFDCYYNYLIGKKANRRAYERE